MIIKKTILTMLLAAAILLPAASCQEIGSPVEGFNWILTKYGTVLKPKTVLEGTEISAYFNAATGTLTGNSGCNDYKTTYAVDHLTLKIIGPISMTKIGCPGEKGIQETEYLNELKAADSFEMDHGRLIIHAGDYRLYYMQTDRPLKTVTDWGE
jgi:heat shock protein HslJ